MDSERRNSMPSRLRTASVSSTGDGSGSENWTSSVGGGSNPYDITPPSSVHSIDLRKGPDPSDRVVTCLLAEDNPITAKIIETLLIRLGCRCVVVADGSEAISVAMGDISTLTIPAFAICCTKSGRLEFDCILMDLYMPVGEYIIQCCCPLLTHDAVDGESAARYIKSTNSKNTNTPIVAISAYSGADTMDANSLFTASLSKPLQKADLLAVMRDLGFKTSTVQGGAETTKLASRPVS
jgi:serine/threonine-protein kinase RIM15